MPTGALNGEEWGGVGCGWGRWGRREDRARTYLGLAGVGGQWTLAVWRGRVEPWYTCYTFGLVYFLIHSNMALSYPLGIQAACFESLREGR